MIAGLVQRDWIEYYLDMIDKFGRFVKGSKPWNKGKTGYMGANKTSFKKGDNMIPLEVRFWGKVNKTDSCWLWTGSINNMGYGRINVKGKIKLAHRVGYELSVCEIPKGKFLLHSCDNPLCVKPKHLIIGTQKDNQQDMSKKGRWGNQFKKNI